jgi:processing peptidase subunit alpha
VRKEDINRIAKKMLTSKPSVAAIGNLKNLPAYKDLELGLLHKDGQMPRKRQFSVFR